MTNIKQYKNAKKNKKNKVLFFYVVLPILITSLFFGAWYKGVAFIEERDAEIFNTGYEMGRYDQLNEDAENTEAEIKANQAQSKKDILNKLAQIESGNGKKRKVLDTNGRYSLGLYHFQGRTVVDMYKRYYGKKITIQEAVAIAQDDKLSTQLAHDAIFVKGEKFHWLLSMCKMGELKKGCLTQKQINNLFAKK